MHCTDGIQTDDRRESAWRSLRRWEVSNETNLRQPRPLHRLQTLFNACATTKFGVANPRKGAIIVSQNLYRALRVSVALPALRSRAVYRRVYDRLYRP